MEASLTCGMKRNGRRAFERRWCKQRKRVTPSGSAVFRYLDAFRGSPWDAEQACGRSWIPKNHGSLTGFSEMNAALPAFVQRGAPAKTATLEMVATLGRHPAHWLQ